MISKKVRIYNDAEYVRRLEDSLKIIHTWATVAIKNKDLVGVFLQDIAKKAEEALNG